MAAYGRRPLALGVLASVKLGPARLLPPEHAAYYLYGEDHDALFEAAEALLGAGDAQAQRLRVDINELGRIEEASRNQGLFGPSVCYALVRNAQSASPKQGEHLLNIIAGMQAGHRLIVCAPGMEWKKALHKKLQGLTSLAQCEFSLPDAAGFACWLDEELTRAGLYVSEDARAWMSESLCGMRLAARQLIERLGWYDDGRGESLDMAVVGDLSGERAPEALEEWCHAVALREGCAVSLAARLLRDQQLAGVQMLSWLGTRMQQLLLFSWFAGRQDRNPARSARVFGEARKRIAAEARCWRGRELMAALLRIHEAERLIKGASIEDKSVVIERLTLDLVRKGGLL